MLNEESEEYTRELQALEETPEMRRDRLKSRARELVRRREKEKREFATLMRERQVRTERHTTHTHISYSAANSACMQFRESCDAFREHDGVTLLQECMASRDQVRFSPLSPLTRSSSLRDMALPTATWTLHI